MIPDKSLSTEVVVSPFVGAGQLPVRDIIDYEDGGVAIQDGSEGLLVQVWRARILDDEIVIDSETTAPVVWYIGFNITEVSLAFDRNMNPVVAFVEDGTPKLNWFDSDVSQQVTTDYPGIVTPRVTHDDKRPSQTAASDVLFSYVRDEGGQLQLYYRQQRDRYTVEYDPTINLDLAVRDDYRAQVAASPGIVKLGMMRNYRIGWLLRTPA